MDSTSVVHVAVGQTVVDFVMTSITVTVSPLGTDVVLLYAGREEEDPDELPDTQPPELQAEAPVAARATRPKAPYMLLEFRGTERGRTERKESGRNGEPVQRERAYKEKGKATRDQPTAHELVYTI